MQIYINKNIKPPITLKKLSQILGYFMWHASKLFKDLTKNTPFDHIRSLRLSQAALTLRDDQRHILDIAHNFVFDSHEGFTRAFSKHFGMSPLYYKTNHPPVKLFMPFDVKTYYFYQNQKDEDKIMEQSIIFTQVIKKPRRKLILKRAKTADDYFAYCEEIPCDIWGELISIKNTLSEPAGYWLSKKLQNGKSQYV